MKTRLVFLEGAPGSGKSTLAAQLAHYMAEKGVPIRLHLEGQAEHPIDLTWHACLTRAEYDCLLAEHLRVGLGDLAERLRQKTVFCAGYALVAYRDLARPFFEGNLLARLKEKEFCYSSSPPVSRPEFTRIFADRWRVWANQNAREEGISLFDAVLLQHPIHDLVRNYGADGGEMAAHYAALIEPMRPFQPVLFYLTQTDVEAHMRETARLRKKPGSVTFEAVLRQQNNKELAFTVMSRLPMKTYLLDTSERDYGAIFRLITQILKV